MTPDCPTDQSLRMYAIGDLDEVLCEEIERHIGDCPACEETVAQFDGVDDTLIRHLPLAAGADARKVTEAPGWLARLRKGPPADVAVEDRPEDLEPWPAATSEDSGPGELAAYELLGVLGRGGMGVVYRARHRQLQRHVALKVLNPRLMATPEGVRRFEREIRILGGLRHGGIVMATDAGRVRGSAYLVMELVEGIDLSRLVKQGGPLPISEACEIARQMAEALAAAHQAGTVHRDVKPSNVMIDAHGRVKLLDFGLARLAALTTQSLETSVGCLLGTLYYMAPEQADSDQPTDPRADFFGLGATLFYLLTGRPPRGGVQRASLLQQLSSLTADAPRVSTIRADVPGELDDFLARLLTRNPQERPDSARAIAAELSQWAGGDLATRVQEFPKQTEATPTDDGVAAQRSLSELLGSDSILIGGNSLVSQDQPTAAVSRGSGRGRKWIWPTVLGSLAAVGAILFGVTIVLQLQQGILRIESEVDNVQVEIVDDKDQTTDLKIDRTGKETTLYAGQYRLRLAGQHDGMVLDNSTVTLTRGKQTVARITRTGNDHTGAKTTTTIGDHSPARSRRYAKTASPQLPPLKPGKYRSVYYFKVGWEASTQRMVPAIQKLKQEGYPIREYDLAIDPERATLYDVAKFEFPQLVIVEDDKVVGRVSKIGGDADDLRPFLVEAGISPARNIARLDGDVFSILRGRGDLSLKENESRIISTRAKLKTVDGFDDHLLKVTATEKPNEIRVQALASPTDASTTLILIDEHGERLLVHVDVETRTAHTLNSGKPYRSTGVTRGSLHLSKAFSARNLPSPLAGATKLLPQGMRLVSVPADGINRGMIRPGDHVDVIWTHHVEAKSGWTFRTETILENAEVFAVDRPRQPDAGTSKLETSKPEPKVENVSLLCTPEQAAILQNATAKGTLQISLRSKTAGPDKSAESISLNSIPPELRAISFPVSLTRLQSRTLKPGDHVDVLYSIQDKLLTYTGTAAEFVEVFAIERHNQPEAATPNPTTNQTELKIETLALLCTRRQAVILQEAVTRGTLQIALRGPTDKPSEPRATASADSTKQARPGAIPAGMRLVSIPVEKFRLSQGTVLPGDRVDLITSIQLNPTPPEPTTMTSGKRLLDHAPQLMNAGLVLQDVEVFAIDRHRQRTTGPASESLTILCTAEQATKLQSTLEKASVTISLRRGKNQAADASSPRPADKPKADQSPASPVRATTSIPGATAVDSIPFRLYQGKTENDWQRAFLAETSPVAKLEAARALLSLASEQPASRQLATILEIGDEVGRAGFGKPPLELAFAYHSFPPEHFTKWRITSVRSELAGTFMKYQDEMYEQLQQIPAEILANGLSTAMQGGSDLHIANAYAVLVGVGYAHIKADPAASKVVLEKLEGVYKNQDHGRLALLARACFLQHATPEKRREILKELDRFCREGNTVTETSLQRLMKTELRAFVFKFTDCPECQKENALTASELILSEMQKRRVSLNSFELQLPFNQQPTRISNPYHAPNHVLHRAQLQHFLPGWLTAVNGYLSTHRAPPYDDATRDIVWTLDVVTPLYSDDDNWPADQMAMSLTEQLSAYYTADPAKMTDQGMRDLLPATTAATLLTQIVRLTGELPDVIREQHDQLRSKPISHRLDRFRNALQGKLNQSKIEDEAEGWKNLMEEAPCEVVRACVRQAKNWGPGK